MESYQKIEMATTASTIPVSSFHSSTPLSLNIKLRRTRASCLILCQHCDLVQNSEGHLKNNSILLNRRKALCLSVVGGMLPLLRATQIANGAQLLSIENRTLCDELCEKEIENLPTVTTESGLRYKDVSIGTGLSPSKGDWVAVNYVARVPSGEIFDSSLVRGQPYVFLVGAGQVAEGIDEGILDVKVGGRRRLYIPGELALPKKVNASLWRSRIPSNGTVTVDISLEYLSAN